jgi:hypothetical protein
MRKFKPHPINTPKIVMVAAPLHMERGCRVFSKENDDGVRSK